MRWLAALMLLPALPAGSGQPLLVGVVADLPGSGGGDEGVALWSDRHTDLTGFVLSDGESSYRIPAGTVLQANETAWFVANASRWTSYGGPPPLRADFSLALGNDGDEVQVLAATGQVLDSFAYGDALPLEQRIATSPGLIYRRLPTEAGWRDTDSPDDWRTARPHRIGESSLDRPTFEVGKLTLYASPDSSFTVLSDLLGAARERVHLHGYELRSMELADSLVRTKTATPTLDLQVLVDGSPVGMDASERHQTADTLRRVQQAGGEAWLSGTGRYDHHHLKVLVVDDAVAIQTENWVASGVPADASWGNRGWGVVVHDGAVADWFATWLAADRSAWDTQIFDLDRFAPEFREPTRQAPRTGDYRPTAARTVAGDFRITPVVAPDHTADLSADPIANLVASAKHRVQAQQLDLALTGNNILGWQGPDAWATALANAASNGADVQVQVAAPFAADDVGNRQAVAWLAERGVAAREFDHASLPTLHNKGFIVDDAVVLGSINGNHRSRSENREVSVVLEGTGLAAYYGALFAADWRGGEPDRDWGAPWRDLHAVPTAPLPMLLAALGVAFALRSRP